MKLFKYIFAGVVIGIANIIPGISGGTMAVLLGIYDRLILALYDLFRFRKVVSSLIFVVPIFFGAIIGIKWFSSIVLMLLEFHYVETQLFWIGLIMGSLPSLVSSFKLRSLRFYEWIILVGSIFLLVGVDHFALDGVSVDSPTIWMFFGIGGIAAAAMIVPGLSGALVMMLLGMYQPVLSLIATLDWQMIIVVGLGAVIGGFVAVIGIKWLLTSYQRASHVAVLGLVLGSIPVLLPSWGMVIVSVWPVIFTFLVGFSLAFALSFYKQ